MKFSFYDFLSNVIPGFLILFSLYIFFNVELKTMEITSSLILSYFIGYLNNSISSWLEFFYYWSWGGKPSNNLLEGKGTWKVKFYEYTNVKSKLKNESSKNFENDALFQIALRVAFGALNQRIHDFNSSYAFSRNLIFSVSISGLLINIYYWMDIRILIISIIVLFICWISAKQKGYYFAREVLNTYLQSKK